MPERAWIVFVGRPCRDDRRPDRPEYSYMVGYGPGVRRVVDGTTITVPEVWRSTKERVATADVRDAWRHRQRFLAENGAALHEDAVVAQEFTKPSGDPL